MNLELFPCSGGMAEGFRRAGITFDFAFDASPDACDSYEHNLGHRPIQMDVSDLLRMVRAGAWSPGPVDLLVADPPCTPWSRAGKRQGIADERDMLVETVAIVEALRPRAWVIANVHGLDDADHWAKGVQPVIGGMAQRCGYCVDYASLDAADYGVPQHRVRPFWFGHPTGTKCIRWPQPTHGDWSTMRLDGRKPWVTCREALQHLPLADLGRPVRLKRMDPKHPPCEPDRPGTSVRSGGNGNAAPHVALVASKKKPWEWPATTLQQNPRIAPPGHHDGSNMSGANAVVLSERAAAILQGFPDGWLFSGKTKKARWSQIGQALPPPFAHAFAESVASWMRG